MKRCFDCNLTCIDEEDICPKCGSKLKIEGVDEWEMSLDYCD